jgi:hypothetical protein
LFVQSDEEPCEQVGAVGLVVFGGVVALALQRGPEFDAGLEERAGFADGFDRVGGQRIPLPVMVDDRSST